MTADKRTVATDALETLGTIIDESAGRDAIHLAVEPVIAAEVLHPGQDVGFVEGGVGRCPAPVGIVDPFLRLPVQKGERFWLVVYPRKITSLRHVWTHPAFDDAPAQSDSEKAEAERWLRAYADEIDEGFGTLIRAAEAYLDHGEYFYGAAEDGYHGKFEGESTHPDFWKHYQAYTGRIVPTDKQDSFFTCSC